MENSWFIMYSFWRQAGYHSQMKQHVMNYTKPRVVSWYYTRFFLTLSSSASHIQRGEGSLGQPLLRCSCIFSTGWPYSKIGCFLKKNIRMSECHILTRTAVQLSSALWFPVKCYITPPSFYGFLLQLHSAYVFFWSQVFHKQLKRWLSSKTKYKFSSLS